MKGYFTAGKRLFLKVPCHAFPVITRPLVCYEGFYACKRSAKSQTLKLHPVASKTLTQKRPVYAAPERLVGDLSFSIVFLEPRSGETVAHLHCRCAAFGGAGARGASQMGVLQHPPPSRVHSRCLADPTQQAGNEPSSQSPHFAAASRAPSRQHGTQTLHSILICLSLLVSFSGC